ncbi:MAG: phytanoyl-CoA dioxygenase family protein [Alphaproteobacteria bacterium]|nr:phytanoyl-CoA dioxygenase family protein [Alphaproteobacteria bacterium]
MSFRLTPEEIARKDRDGFVVRRGVFSRAECARIAGDVEALIDDMLKLKRENKEVVGSYMFEWQEEVGAVVKWEPLFPDVVQGIEPFAHISRPLNEWAHDPRFMDPSRDFVGQDDINLFTEKLTMKRAHTGGELILHQDYPYWMRWAGQADRIMTALLYLDDATMENGCLEVAPGSHTEGMKKRKDIEGFGQNEMDPAAFEQSLVPVEAPAGSIVFFGAFLVHRSRINRSDKDRRALLYSYQPAGLKTSYELHRESRQPAKKPKAEAAAAR